MPDGDLNRVVEKAIINLDDAIYVLGESERLDKSTLKRYVRRQPLDGWRLTLACSDRPRRVDVLPCQGYPWKAFRLALVDGPPFLTWPHIERDGVFCLPEYPSCMTADETLEILQRALADAVALIEACVSGDYAGEFRNEFSSYWSHSVAKGAANLTSICDPHGPTRPIKAWIGKTHIVVGDNDERLSTWLKNYGVTIKGDGTDISSAAFVALKQAPLPRQYPHGLADLKALVGESDPTAAGLIDQIMLTGQKRVPIVLRVPTERGDTLAGIMLTEKRPTGIPGRFSQSKYQRGFRPGKIPKAISISRLVAAYDVSRLAAERADAAWVHGRESDPHFGKLYGSCVVIVGCGSVGSAVAELLAKAGVGRFVLVDHEEMKWGNVGRHELGAGGVYRNKAKALSDCLLRDFPHIQSITAVDQKLEQSLQSNNELARANLIVATTADWAADTILDDWRTSNEAHPPVIYGWTEEYACAGHAVLIAHKDSIKSGFDSSGTPLAHVTSWASGSQLVLEPGCGAVFQPYGPIELSHTAALVSELASDVLLNKIDRSVHRIWAARKAFLTDCGGAWSEWWLRNFPGDEEGGVTRECEWPCKLGGVYPQKEAA